MEKCIVGSVLGALIGAIAGWSGILPGLVVGFLAGSLFAGQPREATDADVEFFEALFGGDEDDE